VTEFTQGQYVELYATIPSSFGGSLLSGTRGIVQIVDAGRSDEAIFLVGFLVNERLTGEQAWLRADDLMPA
jgi:hypothetical protein